MGLFSIFSAHPAPLGWGDVADDRLPTLGDVDMLNRHLLLAAAAAGPEPNETKPSLQGTVSRLKPGSFAGNPLPRCRRCQQKSPVSGRVWRKAVPLNPKSVASMLAS